MAKKAENERKSNAGRPSKYDPAFCDLSAYLSHCETKNELPSKTGYAVYLSVAEQTIDNWSKDYPEFLGCLKELLTIEKQILINKGLTKQYSETLTKFLLSGCHGIREKTEQDVTSGGKPLPALIINMPNADK